MIQLLEFLMFFAIVLILAEHDRPRSGSQSVDEDEGLASRRGADDETASDKYRDMTGPAKS